MSDNELHTKFEEIMVELATIKGQTNTISNAIITANEKLSYTNGKIAEVQKKVWMAIGGVAIVSILVIPLIVYIFQTKTDGIESAIAQHIIDTDEKR